MQITNKSFLRPTIGNFNKYIIRDKKYMIAAIPITINKFGPSGSLNNKNITLENIRDVIPRISSDTFFDLKYIFVIKLKYYSKITFSNS